MTAMRCPVLAIAICTILMGPGVVRAGTQRSAPMNGTVEVSFSIPRPEVTLGEPAYVLFSARNEGAQDATIDLGKNFTAGFRFAIRKPGGVEIEAPVVGAHGMAAVGSVVVRPGKTYSRLVLINEWYHFDRPGSYMVKVQLVDSPVGEPGKILNVWRSPSLQLKILPRNPERLQAVCRKLTGTALTQADLSAASQAALALSYVQDSVALPYLGQLLGARSTLSPIAIRGLVRMGTPEAVRVLDSHVATSHGLLRVQIQEAIQEMRTGVHPTVAD